MAKFLKKFSNIILTIYLALTSIFIGIRLAPGDPVERFLGPEAKMEEIQLYQEQLGLNLPIGQQYFAYMLNISQGKLGESIFKKESVGELIEVSLKPTIIIAILSIVLSSFIGIILGIISAYYYQHLIDKLLRIFTLFGLSFPIFSLAPLLIIFFAIKLNLFPVSEWGGLKHIFLPVLSLTIPLSSIILRVTRNKYLEEKSAPWIQVLRSKGLNDYSINVRLLKIILPTILNVIAIQLSVVLAGTMITETIFDIPGMGSLLFEAIGNRDYPLVQGIIIYSTIIYMLVYFLVDYINEKIDPRIIS